MTEKRVLERNPPPPPYQATMHRATQGEKTDRAFQAYLELLDAADWIKSQVRGQMEIFGVTLREFRVLELLAREGSAQMVPLARKCCCNRQNLDVIVRRLKKRGWVQLEVAALPPAAIKPSRIPKARRGRPRKGPRVATLRLTAEGEEFVGEILPRHAKVVKAFMRALDGREQQTLGALCRKFREGHVLKFISEMEHEDE